MSSASPSKKQQPEFRDQCSNLILLAKGTLMSDILSTPTFHLLSDFCARNHFDLRERMSDALNDVREGWERGNGPASEPPRTVIEVIHLARDRLMGDFGLEEEDDEDDSEEEGLKKDQGDVANRPLSRASQPARRTDAEVDMGAGPSGATRSRAKTSPPKVPRIAAIVSTPRRFDRSRAIAQEGGEEEVDQLVEVSEGSEDAVVPEEFDFRPFLQSPSIPKGWFPWQDKRNVVHYGWGDKDVAPHELVEEMYDSCRVLLKQNVQDSWELVDLDRFFK
ncbi:hypothetical protein V5O48_019198, partial [Marasmius crinis-equi]